MKRKFLSLILVLCLLMPLSLALTACKTKPIETFSLHLALNGGKWSDSYVASGAASSKNTNIMKVVNPDLFDNYTMPKGADVDAPSGTNKIFAGWYFDAACTLTKNWTKQNWNTAVAAAKAEDKKSVTVYAKWVDQGTAILNFNTNYASNTFKNGVQTIFEVTASTYASQQESFPNAESFNTLSNMRFANWYLDSACTILMNPTNVTNQVTTNLDAYVNVYAKWDYRTAVYLQFQVDSIRYEEGGITKEKAVNLTFKPSFLATQAQVPSYASGGVTNSNIYVLVYVDEVYNDQYLLNLAPKASDIEFPDGFGYEISGYQFNAYNPSTQQVEEMPYTKATLANIAMQNSENYIYVEILWQAK